MIESSAIFSEDHVYRYELRKIWNPKKGWICWIMLNPSIADANIEDPTIRRCMGFAELWGYGGITVANAFAFKATDPKEMIAAQNPIGSENDYYIRKLSEEAALTVCGWGNLGTLFDRFHRVYYLLKDPKCLGLTKTGQPKHPLYLAKNTPLIDYKI